MDSGFNFFLKMLFMKKQQLTRAFVLMSAVMLVACGGGGGGGGAGTTTLNGVALKGPMNAALACADENENGNCDSGEPQVHTAADGTFTLSLTKSVPILVVTDASTKDDRGNAMTVGTVLKAPAGSTVVSVATTMIAAGASNDQVAKALGYPTGTDFKTLNPFKSGGTTADQYKFETSAMQVYTAISAIASGASSTGASSTVAFDNAFKALADKANAASSSIDMSDLSEIDDLVAKTKTKMTGVTGFDATKFEAARSDLKNAVANVNTKIKAIQVSDFASSDTSSLYAIATKSVSDQITSRVKDDVPVTLADTSNIDAVLSEQKKVASSTLAKISDMVGFWEGTLAGSNASAILLADGATWLVVNDTVPRVVKAALKVNGGILSGSGVSYPTGSSTKTAVAMAASLDASKLVGSLTDATKRNTFELSAANASTYATAATLASFAKTWTATNSGITTSWTFSDAGVLTGSSVTTGCSYSGKLSLRSEGKAIVDAEVVEKCDGKSDVTFSGIAYINSSSHAVFTLLSSSGPVLLRF